MVELEVAVRLASWKNIGRTGHGNQLDAGTKTKPRASPLGVRSRERGSGDWRSRSGELLPVHKCTRRGHERSDNFFKYGSRDIFSDDAGSANSDERAERHVARCAVSNTSSSQHISGMRKADLVPAAITRLMWCPETAEKEDPSGS